MEIAAVVLCTVCVDQSAICLNPRECRFDSKQRHSLTLTASTPPRRSNAHRLSSGAAPCQPIFTVHIFKPVCFFLFDRLLLGLQGPSLTHLYRLNMTFKAAFSNWAELGLGLLFPRPSFPVCPLDHSGVSFTRLLRCHFLGETYSDPCLGPFGLLYQSTSPLPGFIIFFFVIALTIT